MGSVGGAPSMLVPVSGQFFRAVDPEHTHRALSGSRSAGRFSRPDQPTLYLSSSLEGVAAAMIAHQDAAKNPLAVIAVEVTAHSILDLRDPAARAAADVRLDDAAAPWQQASASGANPPSWSVREAAEAVGAEGLIDPSRKRPGLWHLVLFDWNRPGAATVRLVTEPD